MTLQTRALPALYNGISQQPAILRSPDQMEDELNTWSTMADGVGKRPQTVFVAQIANSLPDNAFIHHINRDVTERYIVIIHDGVITVFDHTTGVEQVVKTPSPAASTYLAGDAKNLRAVTLADYTFIVNTAVAVKMFPVKDNSTPDPDYYIWLNKQGGLSDAALDAILNGSKTGGTYQYQANPLPGTYKGSVASADKLPTTASDGDLYKIDGATDSATLSYYVRRDGPVWDETVAPGLYNSLDPETMPWALVRDADGTFSLAPFSWSPRRVGDDTSNPAPVFVGRSINDVFIYQNRLGLLSDENCVLSCAGDYGNFWRNTVLDYLDSDTISISSSSNNVAILSYALPLADGIFAIADQTQFSITNGENGLTPASVAMRAVTNYEVNLRVRPTAMGTEVYFCGDAAGSSVVWEYTRLADNDSTSAAEITAHVPSLVPAGLTKMAAAPNLKALFAINGSSNVWVYQLYWSGNQKIQSAWRIWDMGAPVAGAEVIDGSLYLIVKRADGVYLERIDMEGQTVPRVLLDRQLTVTGTYDTVTGTTTFLLPYEAVQGRLQIVRGWSHPTRPHSLIDPSGYGWQGPLKVTVPGDETQAPAYIGETYGMVLTFSRQFPWNFRSEPVTTGRLQLRTWTVYYTNAAYFETVVAPYGTAADPDIQSVVPSKLADFTGKIVGSDSLKLNKPAYSTGAYSFQVYGDAAQATVSIQNDSHVQSIFVSAEWEAFYFNRAQG